MRALMLNYKCSLLGLMRVCHHGHGMHCSIDVHFICLRFNLSFPGNDAYTYILCFESQIKEMVKAVIISSLNYISNSYFLSKDNKLTKRS